ncbi:MAG: PKD domain-containing protein [Schleiferiaceae bacterium]|nr:PKD domain-containing protein [Schleiferiaceae bacterium]
MFQKVFFVGVALLAAHHVRAQCPTQSLPYSEDFNTGAGCFTVIDGGTSADTWVAAPVGGTSNVSGDLDSTAYMLVDSDGAGSGKLLFETLQSPVIDADSVNGSLLLSWDQYYNALSSDSGSVEVYDGSQWVSVYTTTSDQGGFGNPDKPSLDITAYANDSLQVRFVYDDNNSWAWYWLVDNFQLQEVACLAPTAAQVTATAGRSATISLGGVADSLDLEWGPVGFTQGTGCLGAVSLNGSSTFTLDSSVAPQCAATLVPNQCYDLYLRRNCSAAGNGTSAWVGPITFCTQCNAVSLPFSEDFNQGPGCFTITDGGTSTDTWDTVRAGGNTNLSGDLDGTGYVAADSDGAGSGATLDEILTSPIIQAGNITGSLILEFDQYYNQLFNDSGFVQVYDGSQWQTVFTANSSYGNFGAPDHQFIDITAYAHDSLQVRFIYRDGGSWAWHWALDNVEISEVLCNPAIALQTTFIGSDSLSLAWNAGTALSFGVAYGPTGFSLGSGTRFFTSADSASISGLTPQTTYDIYLLDSCTNGLTDTLGPLTITTACQSQSIPFLENFDQGQGCFTITDGGSSPDTWFPAPTGGTNNGGDDLNGTGFMMVDSDSAGPGPTLRETLTSPTLDASAYTNGTLVLSFLQYFRPLGDTAVVEVFDGSQWQNVATFSSTLGAWAAPDSQAINVSAYANAHFQVRFIYDDGGGWNWYWSIDNFRVEGFPCSSATMPDTTFVMPDSAGLSWTSSGSLWNINWGPTGFRQGTGTSGNFVRGVTQNPYTLSNLQPNTCYDYYVQDSCVGVGTGPWAGPFTFCTPPTCQAPANITVSNITANAASINWPGGAGNYQISVDTGAGILNPLPVSTNSYAAIGLSSATNYCVYVREICSPGDTSAWAGPVCFNTACNLFTAPFLEDFETATTSCWSNDTVLGGNQWTISTGSSGGSITAAYSGTQNAVFTSGSGGPYVTRFVSPVIDASNLSSTELTFYYGQEVWFGDQNTLTVYYRTSPSNGWVQVFQDTGDVPTWTKAAVIIPSQSATLQVAFEATDNWGRANVLDDVRIDVIGGSCTAPQGMSANNHRCDGMDLSWNSSTGGSIIEYGPAGFTPGTGAFTGLVTPPHTISGLQPNAAYDFYVADTCLRAGSQDTSLFVGPYTDSTNGQGLATAAFTFTYDTLNRLDYTFTATQAAQQYAWDFGDGNTGSGATVSHTYAAGGSYAVELVVSDTCGTDTATQTIADVSTPEWALQRRLSVYPNPTQGRLILDFGAPLEAETRLRITDLSGRVLYQTQLPPDGSTTRQLDMAQWAAGVYLIELRSARGTAQRSITLRP